MGRLKFCSAAVTEFGTEVEHESPRHDLGAVEAEERVVFDGRLPQVLARPVRGQVEAEECVVAFGNLLPKLNEKLFSLERNLDDLRPAESIDLNLVLEHNQSDARHPEMNVPTVRVFARM